MVRDYSRRYSSAGRRQNVRRRDRFMASGDSGLLWKAVGVMIFAAVITGVAVSLWMGWQIDSGLDELGRARQFGQEESLRNKNLLASRDGLRSREKIEVTAAALGLYPPTTRQVRRP